MNSQFVSSVLENAVGGVLTIAFCAAFTFVIRYIMRRRNMIHHRTPDAERKRGLFHGILRWRLSKLTICQDAYRAQEECEGMIEELNTAERAEFVAGLILRPSALSNEIAERAAESDAITQEAKRLSEPSDLQVPSRSGDAVTFGLTFGTQITRLVITHPDQDHANYDEADFVRIQSAAILHDAGHLPLDTVVRSE